MAADSASVLTIARFEKSRIPALPEPPAGVPEAYQQQAAVVDSWLARLGGTLAGYKIACTNAIAQQYLGTDGPFYGRLFSATVYDSPAVLDPSPFFMRVIEPEFGFTMAADLPPRATPYSRDEVSAAVGALVPAIEIVDSRYEDWTKAGVKALIVDNACHGAWVKGRAVSDWRGIDLATAPVRLLLNGAEMASGTGAAVLGHPLNALTWLANRLNEHGRGLRAGDSISTGVCTDICFAQPGDSIVVAYEGLGEVRVSFAA